MIALHHHAKKVVHHIQRHHKKYLLFGGVAGGVFVAIKIVLLFAASFVLYNGSNDASFAQNIEIATETGTTQESTLSTGTIIDTGTTVDTGLSTQDIVLAQDTGVVITTGTSVVSQTGATQESIVSTGNIVNTGTTVLTGTTQTTGVVVSTPTTTGSTNPVYCQSGDFLMTTNLSGVSFAGIIPFVWTLSGGCISPSSMSFQLYDHNNQWIELAQLSSSSRSLSIDSMQLLSGWYVLTGLDASGFVTTLRTGIYPGISSAFWTGYRVRIVNDQTVVYQSPKFTVDHLAPNLSGLVFSSSGYNSGVLGIASPLKIAFDADEQLSGVRLIVASGQATLFNLSGLHYEYGVIMTGGQTAGPIQYTLVYMDVAGNTGKVISGTTLFTFDKTFPTLSNLLITGTVISGISLSYTTSESTLSNAFMAFHNTTTGWLLRETAYATSHNFVFSSLSTGAIYDIGLSFSDVAGNLTKVALILGITSSGSLQASWVATIYGSDVQRALLDTTISTTTGVALSGTDIQSALAAVKQELIKFNDCKDRITYTPIKLQIKGNEFNLAMPSFKKSEVRTIVNAFSYYMVQKLGKTGSLSQTELNEITEKFDSFLVILKLVKDDDNSCKQKLSNYHIREFKETMQTYGITGL